MKMAGSGVLGDEPGRSSKSNFHQEGAGAPWWSFKCSRGRKLVACSCTYDLGLRESGSRLTFSLTFLNPQGKGRLTREVTLRCLL